MVLFHHDPRHAHEHAGWHGERADRVIAGASTQHVSNEQLFERALEVLGPTTQLGISIADAMWALSHVRFFLTPDRCSASALGLPKQRVN